MDSPGVTTPARTAATESGTTTSAPGGGGGDLFLSPTSDTTTAATASVGMTSPPLMPSMTSPPSRSASMIGTMGRLPISGAADSLMGMLKKKDEELNKLLSLKNNLERENEDLKEQLQDEKDHRESDQMKHEKDIVVMKKRMELELKSVGGLRLKLEQLEVLHGIELEESEERRRQEVELLLSFQELSLAFMSEMHMQLAVEGATRPLRTRITALGFQLRVGKAVEIKNYLRKLSSGNTRNSELQEELQKRTTLGEVGWQLMEEWVHSVLDEVSLLPCKLSHATASLVSPIRLDDALASPAASATAAGSSPVFFGGADRRVGGGGLFMSPMSSPLRSVARRQGSIGRATSTATATGAASPPRSGLFIEEDDDAGHQEHDAAVASGTTDGAVNQRSSVPSDKEEVAAAAAQVPMSTLEQVLLHTLRTFVPADWIEVVIQQWNQYQHDAQAQQDALLEQHDDVVATLEAELISLKEKTDRVIAETLASLERTQQQKEQTLLAQEQEERQQRLVFSNLQEEERQGYMMDCLRGRYDLEHRDATLAAMQQRILATMEGEEPQRRSVIEWEEALESLQRSMEATVARMQRQRDADQEKHQRQLTEKEEIVEDCRRQIQALREQNVQRAAVVKENGGCQTDPFPIPKRWGTTETQTFQTVLVHSDLQTEVGWGLVHHDSQTVTPTVQAGTCQTDPPRTQDGTIQTIPLILQEGTSQTAGCVLQDGEAQVSVIQFSTPSQTPKVLLMDARLQVESHVLCPRTEQHCQAVPYQQAMTTQTDGLFLDPEMWKQKLQALEDEMMQLDVTNTSLQVEVCSRQETCDTLLQRVEELQQLILKEQSEKMEMVNQEQQRRQEWDQEKVRREEVIEEGREKVQSMQQQMGTLEKEIDNLKRQVLSKSATVGHLERMRTEVIERSSQEVHHKQEEIDRLKEELRGQELHAQEQEQLHRRKQDDWEEEQRQWQRKLEGYQQGQQERELKVLQLEELEHRREQKEKLRIVQWRKQWEETEDRARGGGGGGLSGASDTMESSTSPARRQAGGSLPPTTTMGIQEEEAAAWQQLCRWEACHRDYCQAITECTSLTETVHTLRLNQASLQQALQRQEERYAALERQWKQQQSQWEDERHQDVLTQRQRQDQWENMTLKHESTVLSLTVEIQRLEFESSQKEEDFREEKNHLLQAVQRLQEESSSFQKENKLLVEQQQQLEDRLLELQRQQESEQQEMTQQVERMSVEMIDVVKKWKDAEQKNHRLEQTDDGERRALQVLIKKKEREIEMLREEIERHVKLFGMKEKEYQADLSGKQVESDHWKRRWEEGQERWDAVERSLKQEISTGLTESRQWKSKAARLEEELHEAQGRNELLVACAGTGSGATGARQASTPSLMEMRLEASQKALQLALQRAGNAPREPPLPEPRTASPGRNRGLDTSATQRSLNAATPGGVSADPLESFRLQGRVDKLLQERDSLVVEVQIVQAKWMEAAGEIQRLRTVIQSAEQAMRQHAERTAIAEQRCEELVLALSKVQQQQQQAFSPQRRGLYDGEEAMRELTLSPVEDAAYSSPYRTYGGAGSGASALTPSVATAVEDFHKAYRGGQGHSQNHNLPGGNALMSQTVDRAINELLLSEMSQRHFMEDAIEMWTAMTGTTLRHATTMKMIMEVGMRALELENGSVRWHQIQQIAQVAEKERQVWELICVEQQRRAELMDSMDVWRQQQMVSFSKMRHQMLQANIIELKKTCASEQGQRVDYEVRCQTLQLELGSNGLFVQSMLRWVEEILLRSKETMMDLILDLRGGEGLLSTTPTTTTVSGTSSLMLMPNRSEAAGGDHAGGGWLPTLMEAWNAHVHQEQDYKRRLVSLSWENHTLKQRLEILTSVETVGFDEAYKSALCGMAKKQQQQHTGGLVVAASVNGGATQRLGGAPPAATLEAEEHQSRRYLTNLLLNGPAS